MQIIWRQIESWLQAHVPTILDDLLPGATDKEIQAAEKLFGVQFPDDVKASYSVHNGQQGQAAPLMGDWQLLSLEDIASQWKIMQDLVAAGKFDNVSSTPIGPVRADWWNPKWIPIAYNGAGDLYCLDLDPAPKGNIGQIITFWHMDDKRERIAKSYQAWLQGFADDLDKGKYKVKDGRLVRVKSRKK